jgi:hypothetical protein
MSAQALLYRSALPAKIGQNSLEYIFNSHDNVRENPNITEDFNAVCFDLDLDQGNIKLDHNRDFEKDSSLFDTEHELITMGAARSSNDARRGVKHIVLIDRRLKEPGTDLELLHTLYHKLSQCVVHEMRLIFDNRPLDTAWRDAFSELVAFLGVLATAGPNRLSRAAWDTYYGYQTRGGAQRALRTLRMNRWRHNPEQYELLYKDLAWVLYEALLSRAASVPTLDTLLRELVKSNGRCVADWAPPAAAGPSYYAAARSRKRRADEYDDDDPDADATADSDLGPDPPDRPAKRPRNRHPGAAPLRELGAMVGSAVAAGWAVAAVAGPALGPVAALFGGAVALRWAAARRARARQDAARPAAPSGLPP